MWKGALPFLGCVGVTLVVANAAPWLALPKHRITLESLHGIERGMTREQVLEILAVPPGNYSGGGWAEYFGFGRDECSIGEEWVGDELAIRVVFNDAGIVQSSFMGEVHRKKDVLFELRRRLGLAKRPIRVRE